MISPTVAIQTTALGALARLKLDKIRLDSFVCVVFVRTHRCVGGRGRLLRAAFVVRCSLLRCLPRDRARCQGPTTGVRRSRTLQTALAPTVWGIIYCYFSHECLRPARPVHKQSFVLQRRLFLVGCPRNMQVHASGGRFFLEEVEKCWTKLISDPMSSK